MATVVRIPLENSIYDWIRIALRDSRYDQAIAIYSNLTPQEQQYFRTMYPEIYNSLYQIYMTQEMTAAAHALHM
jgi:ribonuclease HIII